MLKFQLRISYLGASMVLLTIPAFCQNAPPRSNQDVLNELQSLKNRIAQLEAELRSSSATASAAPAPVPASAPATSSFADPAAQPATAAPQQQQGRKPEPFAFADFTWLTGNPRTTESPLDTKAFTPEIRIDSDYVYDFNHPRDHSIGGSSEIFRSGEVQVTQMGVGGDFHWNNVRGRLMTQFGMYSVTTPRNDSSPALGQWTLDNAYRYISEAYGGYHFNKLNGINVDAGIFMSYVGLYSYYQFDNWSYQPSYVS
jgi:hypothetical protein